MCVCVCVCVDKCMLVNAYTQIKSDYDKIRNYAAALAMWTIHPHHISALIVDIILNTLRSHPPDGHLLLTSHHTLPPTEVVSAIHVFCETKISYFDHSTTINPAYINSHLKALGSE